MIFNSFGSNYNFGWAIKYFLAKKDPQASQTLKQLLADKYQGKVWLYYRGRAALSEAVRLSQADYVAVNSFTCYAVEQAISRVDGQPVFADIDETSLHFKLADLRKLHRKYPKIKAVIIQNTLGISIEVKPIVDYCRRHKLILIEDLAHCLNGHYKDGEAFGTVGDLVILSFGRDKQIDVVNGGALIVRNQDLSKQVRAPQAIKGYWRLRLADRFYPLLSTSIRIAYKCPLVGKSFHRLLAKSNIVKRSTEALFLDHYALPSYRSSFIIKQFENLQQRQKDLNQLIKIYEKSLTDGKAVYQDQSLLRYPVLLKSTTARNLFLQEAQKAGFYLRDIWYDDFVYPARFSDISRYQAGSCPNKESVCQRIINLPLHQQMTRELAQKLVQIVVPYLDLDFVTEFSSRSWQVARQSLQPIFYNLLTSASEIEAFKNCGYQVYQLAVKRQQQTVALVVAIVVNAKRGRFLKLAGNPLFASDDPVLRKIVIAQIKTWAKNHNCAFIRLQPCLENNDNQRRKLADLDLRLAPSQLNAPDTLKVDLTKSSDEIWSSVPYRKTRSRIRKARKDEVKVIVNNTSAGFKSFFQLLDQTQSRQNFIPNPKSLIEQQLKTYHKNGKLHLYQAVIEEGNKSTVIASTVLIDDDYEMVDLYGATNEQGLKLYGAYLIKWQIILDAQKRGVKLYNLWGAAPPGSGKDHHFYGFTVFKKNFGGEHVSYLPSHDLILKRWRYLFVYCLETYRNRKKRG